MEGNFMTRLPISWKIGLILLLNLFLMMGILIQTYVITAAQKADALVINMAGRQRMLTQKMTKSVYSYVLEHGTKSKNGVPKDADVEKSEAESAASWFDKTINALIEGGVTPLGKDISSEPMPPASNPEILRQLQAVKSIWSEFHKELRTILNAEKTTGASFEKAKSYIKKNNIPLLVEMNKAVKLIEAEANKRVEHMKNVQLISFIVEVCLFLGGMLLVRTSVINPINEVITHLSEGSQQIARASGDISTTSQTLAQSTADQASSLEETSSSLEEMSSMTKQNADNAKSANQLAAQARNASKSGNESILKMIAAMNEINESSNKVSKIIKVIEEIAFQTNLLALNAAVEAARAGEAGKGFAVVAEEVRSLAQRCASAAKDTSGLIEESVQRAKNGSHIASEAEASLKEILGSIEKVATLVNEISSASQEQAQGVGQINSAVTQMDSVTQQNASNAEESAAASEELSAQAGKLETVADSLIMVIEGSRGGKASTARRHASLSSTPKTKSPKNPVETAIRPVSRESHVVSAEETIPMDSDFQDF